MSFTNEDNETEKWIHCGHTAYKVRPWNHTRKFGFLLKQKHIWRAFFKKAEICLRMLLLPDVIWLCEQDSFLKRRLPTQIQAPVWTALPQLQLLQCFLYTVRLPALFQHKIVVGISRKDTDDIKLLIEDPF